MAQLRAVAYRMLGSVSEADDTMQETWVRSSRADVLMVLDFTIREGKMVAIDAFAGPERLRELELSVLDE